VALTLLVFVLSAFAFHRTPPGDLSPWLVPALALVSLCAAGALCASAVASSLGGAIRGLLAGGFALAGAATVQWLGPWQGHVWRREAILALASAQAALWTLALLLAAWGAVRRAPADPGRWRGALRRGALPLAVGLLPGLVPALIPPLQLGAARVVGGADLGGGSRLELVRTPAMNSLTVAPRVVLADGRAVTISRTVPAPFADAFVDAASGRALLLDMTGVFGRGCADPDAADWFLVDRAGGVRAGFLPSELDSARLRTVGWSPGGHRFAWLVASRAELLILEENLQTRRLDLPPGADWEASWLDEQRLALTAPAAQGASRRELIDLGSP
jgi:hypothetical protein